MLFAIEEDRSDREKERERGRASGRARVQLQGRHGSCSTMMSGLASLT